MSIFELALIGVALAMDAFAVAICKGLSMKTINYRHAAVIALYFGVFQGLMPVIGWLAGTAAHSLIEKYDHWVAFILLIIIGANMIREAVKGDDEEIAADSDKLDHKELLVLAVATSIDALAVGIAFAMQDVRISLAAVIIGVITFALSFMGVAIGNKLGEKFQAKAQIAGGIVLIGIGLKILLEHLQIF